VSVAGSACDLRSPTMLGQGIPRVHGAAGIPGFDISYCLCSRPPDNAAATLLHRDSGRLLRVFTDLPCLHVYTGNHVDGIAGKLGASYGQHCSIALETQNYADAVNHVSHCTYILYFIQAWQNVSCRNIIQDRQTDRDEATGGLAPK